MHPQVVIVTGAAGFLGSAITVDLCKDHRVVAIDRREPTGDLVNRAAGTDWHCLDIADADAVNSAFARTRERLGRIDLVVHFAAFYHFGTDWHSEYQRTNLRGTANVLRAAVGNGAKRLIFASSVAAMLPPPSGETLTETTPSADYLPYAKSKSLGEHMIRAASDRLPALVLRIGGVFSDWSELPPLTSLIQRWAGRWPLSCLVPGRGTTGVPYLHRSDLVRMVRSCVARHLALAPCEVFLASPDGAVLHKELFAAIRRQGGAAPPRPIFIPPSMARIGLSVCRAFGRLVGRPPFERPWMVRFVDRPWVVNAVFTRRQLGWNCAEGMGILDRVEVLLEHFRQDRRTWKQRNRMRSEGKYAYRSEDHGNGPA